MQVDQCLKSKYRERSREQTALQTLSLYFDVMHQSICVAARQVEHTRAVQCDIYVKSAMKTSVCAMDKFATVARMHGERACLQTFCHLIIFLP